MVVTIVPANGSTIKNGSLVNTGGIYDTDKSIFRQGTWVSDSLNGDNCIKTEYGDAIVNIKCGSYLDGYENGNITEYELPKSSWLKFIGGDV